MFKLMGKEINAILGAQTILIWTYELHVNVMNGSAHEIFILIESASSESTDEPVHARSIARACASRMHKIESSEKLKQNIRHLAN